MKTEREIFEEMKGYCQGISKKEMAVFILLVSLVKFLYSPLLFFMGVNWFVFLQLYRDIFIRSDFSHALIFTCFCIPYYFIMDKLFYNDFGRENYREYSIQLKSLLEIKKII